MIKSIDRTLALLIIALVSLFISEEAIANNSCDFFTDNPTEKLYQLHNDGSIWVKNDKDCGTDPACSGGWFLLDKNLNTVSIAAYCELYQMHNDGSIFYYTGNTSAQDQCTNTPCIHWQQLDKNTQSKAITVGAPYATSGPPVLYQIHGDGSIYRKNGKVCTDAACFGGWDTLDLNPHTVAIAAGFNGLFQLHDDGKIYRWDGKTLCVNNVCAGWVLLDQNANNLAIAAGHGFYRLDKDGGIFFYQGVGFPLCSTDPCPNWRQMGVDAMTAVIKAGDSGLFRLRKDGQILQGGCDAGNVCGWTVLDQHPSTVAIAVGANLYQMRDNGIFMFNGRPCAPDPPGCKNAWTQLDANPATKGIVANGVLFSR